MSHEASTAAEPAKADSAKPEPVRLFFAYLGVGEMASGKLGHLYYELPGPDWSKDAVPKNRQTAMAAKCCRVWKDRLIACAIGEAFSILADPGPEGRVSVRTTTAEMQRDEEGEPLRVLNAEAWEAASRASALAYKQAAADKKRAGRDHLREWMEPVAKLYAGCRTLDERTMFRARVMALLDGGAE